MGTLEQKEPLVEIETGIYTGFNTKDWGESVGPKREWLIQLQFGFQRAQEKLCFNMANS